MAGILLDLCHIGLKDVLGEAMVTCTDVVFRNVLVLSMSVIFLSLGEPSKAREIEVDGRPCNDLCQAWLGLGRTQGLPEETSERSKPSIRQPIVVLRPVVSKPVNTVRRPKMEAEEAEPAAAVHRRIHHEVRNATARGDHIRLEIREAKADVPLPIPRPTLQNASPAVATDDSTSAASRSPEASHDPTKAAAPADVGMEAAALKGQVPAPTLERRAAPEVRGLSKGGSQAELPPPPVAMPSRAAFPSYQLSQVATTVPVEDAPKRSAAMSADPPVSAGVSGADKPSVQAAPAREATVARPSIVVASLPPLPHAEERRRDDDRPGENTQEGSLRPMPELAGGRLPVTIGQVSAEARGTDVHVVIVNVLQHEIKDVDVTCRAHDARGLQVAEASAHIENIAPSDVAFEQVFFPAGITAKDSKFICDVGGSPSVGERNP